MKKILKHIQSDHLSAEERDIEKAFERGELRSVHDLAGAKKALATSAVFSRTNSKHISLRVPNWALTDFKSRALKEGLPYQTAINALIHKYAAGDIRSLVS
jgi:predicted DNA binding CopG/RHH family protein